MNRFLFWMSVVIVLTALCLGGLDIQVAHFILIHVGRHFEFSRTVSSLPDLLLLMVIIVSTLAWAGYFFLSSKGISDQRTRLFLGLGTSLPVAFASKDLLKWIFGRVDTRFWLAKPDSYAFHWFHGGRNFEGFPSGHMLVFTPLFLALWNFSPKARPLILTAWLGLAAALLITEYHFLGDVIAGSYAGYLIYHGLDRIQRREG